MNRLEKNVLCGLCLVGWCFAPVCAQEKYKNFDDAMSAGVRLLRGEQKEAAIEPLESAVKLAPDEAKRLRAYEALVPAYRTLPEIDKMLAAQEYIIRHSDRRAGRSQAARDLASFLFQRGKLDLAIERYEAELKKNAKDPAALTVLTTIFTQAKRNDPRGPELKTQLDGLDRELAAALAQRLEKDAETAPRIASWLLKDAATAWLEAEDKGKALAAAKKSAAGAPEQRSQILTYQWHNGLGDVFLQTGEAQLAVAQFEAALANTDQPALRKGVEKKLAEARGGK